MESRTIAYGRERPYSAKLIDRVRLSGAKSAKDVWRLVFDSGDALDYSCGDTLGVYPRNDGAEVDSILNVLELRGDSTVEIRGISRSIRDALIENFCITHLPKRFLEAFEQKLTGGDRTVFGENFSDQNEDHFSLFELLTQFPYARLSCDELCKLLKKMPPRLYSIASSRKAQGNELHIIVGAVSYKNFLGNVRRGVASTFLASRLRVGDFADIYVSKSAIKLPPDPSVDIIMVGPGTGIAPFIGFLHEREYLRNRGEQIGRSWLFFGDQHEDSDFLEKDKLLKIHRDGPLNNLDLAFSRDQSEKIYVQHRMFEKREKLWQWLSTGAYFYICGNAKRMALDVEDMLKNIAVTVGRISEGSIDDWIGELKSAGRYQKDVY
jgi:sulfite reductase (NADPH) flavoprotein alpha-component